jgi:hypothetical protein
MAWSLFWNWKIKNCLKNLFLIKIAPSNISSLNFGNSYLNYIYSINCLIKNLKYNDFKITLRNNSQKNSWIMFQIYVIDNKVQGKKLVLLSWNVF